MPPRQIHPAIRTDTSQVPGAPGHREDGPVDIEPTMVQRGWDVHTGALEPGRMGWDSSGKCRHHGDSGMGRAIVPAWGLEIHLRDSHPLASEQKGHKPRESDEVS